MPEVSIVLPTYNGSKYICESIDSIIRQTYKDWELIIVNDCSTDDTLRIINQYAINDSRIRVINNLVNQKLPKSLNIGFRETNGKFLTWTSDDNYYLNNAIEKMVNFLKINTKYPMVCTAMDYIDSNGEFIKRSNCFDMPRMYFEDRVGACFMYRREVLSEVGEYNPKWFRVEDYEYWYRIMEQYGSIGYIPECLYKYRVHKDSLTGTQASNITKLHYKMLEEHIETIVDRLATNKQYLMEAYYTLYKNGVDASKLNMAIQDELELITFDGCWDYSIPTLVYGAGEFGNKAFKMLGNKILFFVDSDEEKQGTKYNGIQVISPNQMKALKQKCNICVAVSAFYMYDVVSKLYKLGIKRFCSVYFLENEFNVNHLGEEY